MGSPFIPTLAEQAMAAVMADNYFQFKQLPFHVQQKLWSGVLRMLKERVKNMKQSKMLNKESVSEHCLCELQKGSKVCELLTLYFKDNIAKIM